MPPKRNGMGPVRVRKQPEKNTDDYLKKRERNNEAVKKSREKSRQKQKETMQMVVKLRTENADLERKVKLLTKELDVLKDLFLSHAASVRQEPDPPVQNPVIVTVKTEPVHANQQPVVDHAAALMDHEYCS